MDSCLFQPIICLVSIVSTRYYDMHLRSAIVLLLLYKLPRFISMLCLKSYCTSALLQNRNGKQSKESRRTSSTLNSSSPMCLCARSAIGLSERWVFCVCVCVGRGASSEMNHQHIVQLFCIVARCSFDLFSTRPLLSFAPKRVGSAPRSKCTYR